MRWWQSGVHLKQWQGQRHVPFPGFARTSPPSGEGAP